jgi:signal transduction histidine kinase
MSLREWLRSFRHPLALSLAATLVPGVILGWLGWRLLREDQVLESRRTQARLESAAEGAATALDRNLAELEERLSTLAAAGDQQAKTAASKLGNEVGEDALVVMIDHTGVEAYPSGHLIYYPSLPVRREPEERLFAAGEVLELQRNDPAGASVAFRELARSPDPGIRAGALLRLARSLRKTARPEKALAAYSELAELAGVTIRGIPAELLARQARCSLLDEMARVPEMSREARTLYSDLQNARWMLTRTVYRFHSDEARRRLKPDRELEAEQAREQERLALAEGVESLWDEWQRLQRGEGDPSGRGGFFLSGHFVSLFWRSQPERMTALVGGPRFVASHVLERIQPFALRHGVSVMLADAEGHTIGGAVQGTRSPQVVRSPAESRLPWTLLVGSLDPVADVAEVTARRRILLAGFAVMVLVILAGSYSLARAVTREMEVARLKSDFVAAVSHEFRTPLASMCQIAELFAEGRVPDEEQGRQYYGLLVRESRRLKRLVENLLDFARMEGGAKEYRLEALDAATLVKDTVSEFQEEVLPRGYQVGLSIEDPEATLQADGEALRRALWNLLDNAVKYSPDCHTVWVEVAREENQCRILVRDRGLGISPPEQKHIFEKFARSTSSKTAGVKGTGIGLSMVDHIVRAHRGRIRVESESGCGSTFAILLPLGD